MSNLVTSDRADHDDDDPGVEIEKFTPCASEVLHLGMTFFNTVSF